MINVQRFVCNMIQENCYVASDETKECVIIDCGAFYEEERKAIVNYIDSNGLKPVHLLATHGHLDHNFGDEMILDKYGLRPEISKADESLLKNAAEQAEAFFHFKLEQGMPAPEHFLKRDEIVSFGNHKLKVLETPGHSRGSVVFYCEQEDVAFTGDTLFRGSIGRTDFEGGSMLMIIQSLRMLAQLPDETVVLPGHGEQTTIGYELAHNPYMER